MSVTRRSLRAAALAMVVAACGTFGASPSPSDPSPAPAHWSYEGEEGPAHWADLDPAYQTCSDGSAQAPIDIVDPAPIDLANPEFRYQAADARVVNNGHTVQAIAGPGSAIAVGQVEFALVQAHFHAPSEHTIDGRPAPVEAHFVHAADSGRLAVVGVMLTEGESSNAAWAPYVDSLAVGHDEVRQVRLDWRAMLPDSAVTVRYQGSLTTPPCTEGVQWLLMDDPVLLSAAQIAAFEAAYHGNRRPIQPLNDRRVEIDSTP